MRVVPIGRAVWLRDDERDGVYLAALVVTPQWACITAGSWTRDPGGGVRDRMWFCEFAATDDTGASYKMGYNGAGTPQIQAGPFELAPQPPAEVRWLDVTPGPGRAVRADLTAPAVPVQVTWEECSMAAAGLVLHRAANRMLAYWEPDRRIVNSQLEGFGATVAALAEAGGLPADSPLPGQLAALCEQLGVTGHGITAAPRHDLPEPWRSVAAYHLGETPEPAPMRPPHRWPSCCRSWTGYVTRWPGCTPAMARPGCTSSRMEPSREGSTRGPRPRGGYGMTPVSGMWPS